MAEVLDVENPFTFARGFGSPGSSSQWWRSQSCGWATAIRGWFFSYVQEVFSGMLALGALLAINCQVAAGEPADHAGGALGAIAVNQLIGRHSALVMALPAAPSGLWVFVGPPGSIDEEVPHRGTDQPDGVLRAVVTRAAAATSRRSAERSTPRSVGWVPTQVSPPATLGTDDELSGIAPRTRGGEGDGHDDDRID